MTKRIVVILVVFAFVPFSRAQSGGSGGQPIPEKATQVLDAPVPRFVVKQATILDALSALTFQAPSVSYSFEDILKNKFGAAPITRPSFNIDVQDATVRQVLDRISSADPRYTWSQDGFTINIVPRAAITDTTYLLNRTVNVDLHDVRNAQEAVFATVKALPPPFEQIAVAQYGGDISFAQPWSTSFSNITVRQALNRIAQHISTHSGWIFEGSADFRTVSFYSGHLRIQPAP